MFYVAMTRAREQLHIFLVRQRYGKASAMSRFVGEILLDPQQLRPGARVVHETYGPGEILAVDGRALTIRFDAEGQERRLDLMYCLSRQLLRLA